MVVVGTRKLARLAGLQGLQTCAGAPGPVCAVIRVGVAGVARKSPSGEVHARYLPAESRPTVSQSRMHRARASIGQDPLITTPLWPLLPG